MTGEPMNRKIGPALWMGALCILAGSYYGLASTYGRNVQGLQAASQSDYVATLRNRKLIANAGKARALAAELEQRLQPVMRATSSSATVATFLQDLDTSAKTDGCQLLSIVPAQSQPTSTAAPASTARKAGARFPYAPLGDADVVVRGSYPGLLRFLRGMSSGRTLVEVKSVSLAIVPHDKPRGNGALDATIHVTIFHYAPSTNGTAS